MSCCFGVSTHQQITIGTISLRCVFFLFGWVSWSCVTIYYALLPSQLPLQRQAFSSLLSTMSHAPSRFFFLLLFFLLFLFCLFVSTAVALFAAVTWHPLSRFWQLWAGQWAQHDSVHQDPRQSSGWLWQPPEARTRRSVTKTTHTTLN